MTLSTPKFQLQSSSAEFKSQVILVYSDNQPISQNGIVYTNVPVTEFEVQNLEPGNFSSL